MMNILRRPETKCNSVHLLLS